MKRIKLAVLFAAVIGLCVGLGALTAGALSPHSAPDRPAGVSKKYAGSYQFTITVNNVDSCGFTAGVTYTGSIFLNDDGTWTSSGVPGDLEGSWLEYNGAVIALSDVGSLSCGNGSSGGTYLAAISGSKGNYQFGNSSKQGILNSPYNWYGNWYATEQGDT
jgi:hypothetical protein